MWHNGLLHKLYLSGVDGNLLACLTDHLKDRQQCVVVGGQHSNWGTITAGVPQGGVLGPLTFLIYINDIVNCVKNVQVRLFADDACLFLEVDNRRETAEKVNNDLNRIEK